MRLLEKSNTITILDSIKESTKEPVKVMLYDKWEEYPSVEEAKADMLEAMSFCDPQSHEYSRYAFVLQQLMQGKTTCYDNIDDIPEGLEDVDSSEQWWFEVDELPETKEVVAMGHNKGGKNFIEFVYNPKTEQLIINKLEGEEPFNKVDTQKIKVYFKDSNNKSLDDLENYIETYFSSLKESVINENVKGIDISRLAKFLEDSSKALYKSDSASCYRFLLPDPRLAIYVGWSPGFGDEERDDIVQSKSNPDYGIEMGIKIRNDADWADYEFLNYPYSENGDVWDAALSVDNLETEDWISDAEYLAGEYEAILKQAETDKDFVIEESIKIKYLDEAENPENKLINSLIRGLLTGQTKAKQKLEKMGYTVEFDDDAYKQFGKDYFGKYVRITNNKTGKQIVGSYGSRWGSKDFISAKPVEDNSASSDPVKKQQWNNSFHKITGKNHVNDKMADPNKFDYKGYLDKETPDLSEPESEFQRFKKDKAYLKDKEHEAKRIDAARERVANVRNKLNGVVKESFDANEPNTMETVRKYVEENPNGGSILINTFSDNWPHDPLTKEDVGKVIHDVRYYPGNGVAIESYEVEEDPEEYEGGFGYKSLGNYEEPDGFDLNFTDEEVATWAKNFLGINDNIKESVIDVKYIGKDDWDRHIVKDPKTGKFYGDVNLTTVGKDKDLSNASWHTYSGNDPYDGEPEMPIGDDIKFNIVNPDAIPSDYQRFEYSLLSRLESDCKYFLGNGNGNVKDLWAGSVDKQIAKMKELYNQLEEKPEWITMEDIDNYEKQMKEFVPNKGE